ncbi:MAG TPA: hypothetical protein PK208_03330 [Fibrobacteria bacterium]|nr:hypothetical protein [Fibrobacteria bacterium]
MKNKSVMAWGMVGALLLGGCLQDSEQVGKSDDLRPAVMAVYTDYKSYGVARIVEGAVTDSFAVQDAAGFGATIDAFSRVLYVTNQGTGTVTAFRNGVNDADHAIFDISVGKGTNPYQVLQVGSRLFVARWEKNNILVLDAATGDSVRSIDLSANANDEGAVRPCKLEFAGGKLWVLAQGVRSDYTYDSAIAVPVDTGASKAERGIVLPSRNPVAMSVVGEKLYVVSQGSYDTVANAGVERIDLATRKWEATVGGLMGSNKPRACAYAGGRMFLAVMRDKWGTTSELVPFDLATGAMGTPVPGLSAVWSVVSNSSTIWVADRAKSDKHSVAEIDPATATVVRTTKTPLPPAALAILK